MNWRRGVQLMWVGALVSAGTCVGTTLPPVAASQLDRVRVRAGEHGRDEIRNVPLEEYVAATAISEFAPPSGDSATVERMLEVQAVISRTYALSHLGRHTREGYDLCSTTHCQLYEPGRLRSSRWAAAATEAARKTAGMVLWYDGALAQVLFHADCGGHTSSPNAVWGGPDLPYLLGRPDAGPARGAHETWQYSILRADLLHAANSDPRTRVGRRMTSLQILERDEAGRARRVVLRGEFEPQVRGEDLREVLTRRFGPHAIRSTLFDVRERDGRFQFIGRGFGHGVGLCQAGALARLVAGANPSAVLQYYFPGTKIVRIKS